MTETSRTTTAPGLTARPAHVDITWLSITNVYYDMASLGVLTDGYISRIPQAAFFGGGGGLAYTRQAFRPDIDAVERVLAALGGASRISLLLTGHSHFDHSFDTAVWATLTGAPVIGSKSTCFQAVAQHVPLDRCTSVEGGEAIALSPFVTMRVVRWNHSGDPAVNPEQHNAVELRSPPTPDAMGGLRPGVAEDFPNGGGNRGFLFVVDGEQGRFSWFYQNSASAVDLHVPIVVDGIDHGAPIENLHAAMEDAQLDSVDLWIGTGGLPVASLVMPVIKARAYMPVHWDGLWGAFEAGLSRPYADPALEAWLTESGVTLVKPVQYMDKWRLDPTGIRSIENSSAKQALGFER